MPEPWYAKVWKSLAALAVVFGLLGPTGIRIHWMGVLFVSIVVIALAMYWHLIEVAFGAYRSMRAFIIEIREDIRTVRSILEERYGPEE